MTTATTKTKPKSKTTRSRPRPARARRRAVDPSWGQLAAVGVVGLVALLLFAASRSPGNDARAPGTTAPAFSLASTAGGSVSLSDFAGGDVLLYFNEGVGCDACFYQTVELERNQARFEQAGVSLVAIVVNPLDMVRSEVRRFGIRTPYLIDEGAAVSRAYGMLGKGMHADLPGHGFVLIDGDGRIRWQREYPSMYASTEEILAAIEPYLA